MTTTIDTPNLDEAIGGDSECAAKLQPIWRAGDIHTSYPASTDTVVELLRSGAGMDASVEMLEEWARRGMVAGVRMRSGQFSWTAHNSGSHPRSPAPAGRVPSRCALQAIRALTTPPDRTVSPPPRSTRAAPRVIARQPTADSSHVMRCAEQCWSSPGLLSRLAEEQTLPAVIAHGSSQYGLDQGCRVASSFQERGFPSRRLVLCGLSLGGTCASIWRKFLIPEGAVLSLWGDDALCLRPL